jgi:hypothetical protein
VGESTSVLLFELFPAFVMVVGLVAAIGLFVADRRSRKPDDSESQKN